MKEIRFRAHEIRTEVRALMTGPVTVVQHDTEGWQQVQRMWRTSFTEWQGAPGYELQIPIIFDKFPQMVSVEKEISRMEKMARKLEGKARTPILEVDAGGACPHDSTNDPDKLWVCSACAWTADYVTNREYKRVRQETVVTVWEWIPDKLFTTKERVPHRHVPRTYKIKKHDTLQKIAAFFFHDQAKWHDIARLNHIRDPLHLRVGRVIKLPQHLEAVKK